MADDGKQRRLITLCYHDMVANTQQYGEAAAVVYLGKVFQEVECK